MLTASLELFLGEMIGGRRPLLGEVGEAGEVEKGVVEAVEDVRRGTRRGGCTETCSSRALSFLPRGDSVPDLEPWDECESNDADSRYEVRLLPGLVGPLLVASGMVDRSRLLAEGKGPDGRWRSGVASDMESTGVGIGRDLPVDTMRDEVGREEEGSWDTDEARGVGCDAVLLVEGMRAGGDLARP